MFCIETRVITTFCENTAAQVYHAFVHKLDPQVRLLLGNAHVNKRANGGGAVTWDKVVAMCRESLVGVSFADVGTSGSGAGTMAPMAGQDTASRAGQM